MKRCTACGEEKPLSEFHRDKRTKDGRCYRCKKCTSAYGRAHHARPGVRAKHNAQAKRWREENPAAVLRLDQRKLAKRKADGWPGEAEKRQTAEWKAYQQTYAQRNADRVKEIKRRHYERNREEIIARSRRWEQAHPAERRAYREKRRRALVHDETSRAYMRVLGGDPCSYCTALADTIDHIDAVDNGGTGDWTNLTPACRRCNGRKQAAPFLMFMRAELAT